MQPDPPEHDETLHRAERRKRRQRRHRRILGWSSLALLVLGLGAVAFVVFVAPREGTTKVAASEERGSTSTAAAAADPELNAAPPRALTVDDPLRLWIGGDSLAGSLGPSLGQMTAETGVVQPQFDSRVSSGLLNPGFFNWPKEAASEMTALDPEVVVYIIGANDYSSVPDASDTTAVAEFKANYKKKIEEMLDVFDTTKRTVYWVSPPVMKATDMNDAIKIIQETTEETLKGRKNVVYIDGYPVLDDIPGDDAAGHTGGYTSRLVDPTTGKTIVVRAGDGIHLTADGGDLLAAAVFTPLNQQWHITEQAVAGHVKSVRQTKGSNQVPGTSRQITGNTVVPTTNPQHKTTSTTTVGETATSSSGTSAPASGTSEPGTSTTAATTVKATGAGSGAGSG